MRDSSAAMAPRESYQRDFSHGLLDLCTETIRGEFRCGSFQAEFVAEAEADEEEENGAEDGLDSGKYVEPSERSINHQIENLEESKDIQRIRGAKAQGFPTGAGVEIRESSRANRPDPKKSGERPAIAAAVVGKKPIKRNRETPSPQAELHTARLHLASEEVEFVIMLFQPFHFALKARVRVGKSSRDLRVLRLRPFNVPPDCAFMKFSVEEFRRLRFKCHPLKPSYTFHYCTDEAAISKKRRALELERGQSSRRLLFL